MRLGTKWLCFYLGFCSTTWFDDSSAAQNDVVRPVYEWSQLEYDYPTEADRQAAIDSGEFNDGRPTPIDVDVYYGPNNNNKVFVTMPRFQNGVPATLGTITDKKYKGNPVIAPYPSWSWHKNPTLCSPDRIVSVYRIKIDECGRLWVLDTGRLVDDRICNAQILAFDLETNQLLHRYEIPDSQLESTSILVTPIVDVRDPPPRGTCKDTFVYVADCQVNSLIVHDVQRSTSWQVIDKTMYPFPTFGTFKILGQQFELMDGILGMDLSPYKPGEDRTLYFHAMSSGTENWVHTSNLRNDTLFLHDPTPAPEIFHTYRGHRNTQCPAQAIDKNGVSYFGLVSETAINCWNTKTEYGLNNIDTLSRNPKTMQFASGIKVINGKRGSQELWFVTMRFQKVATDTLNLNEINYRIQTADIETLTRGSKCVAGIPSHNNNYHHHHHNNNQGNYGNRPGSGNSPTKNNNKRDVDSVYFPSD